MNKHCLRPTGLITSFWGTCKLGSIRPWWFAWRRYSSTRPCIRCAHPLMLIGACIVSAMYCGSDSNGLATTIASSVAYQPLLVDECTGTSISADVCLCLHCLILCLPTHWLHHMTHHPHLVSPPATPPNRRHLFRFDRYKRKAVLGCM